MSTQTVRTADTQVIPFWSLGDRIRKARHVAGLDQRAFAAAIGATPSQVASWETDRSVPRDQVAIARRIELLTRIPAAWVLGVDESTRPAPVGGAAWAPWDSNPQPTVSGSVQVSEPQDARIYEFPVQVTLDEAAGL